MSRIADALGRESQTVDLEQGAFERLLARRDRKQRNRRIRAGVVGVIVALATAAFLVRAIGAGPLRRTRHRQSRIGAGEVLYGVDVPFGAAIPTPDSRARSSTPT